MVRMFFDAHEPIVQRTLECIAEISNSLPPDERPVIVGGMAIQLYAYDQRSLLRPTSDVDILDVMNHPYEEFSRGIGADAVPYLGSFGYQIQLKRARDQNELKIMKGQNAHAEELFFAHFTRYAEELFKSTKQVSLREASNARESRLPYDTSSGTVKLKLIEDIVPYKIKRIRTSLESLTKMGETEEPLHRALLLSAEEGDWESLAGFSLPQWCQNLTLMQADLQSDISEGSLQKRRTKYKLNKDIYDLCLLSQVISGKPSLFNRAYYLTAKREVDSI
jgi:hypothetical protein